MSGGVDSSVTAYLLKQNNYDCTGATMRLFLNGDIGLEPERPCCSLKDVEDAQAICNKLNINHEVIYYMLEFKEFVIDKFIATYKSGGTPNPCIDCNKYLKFQAMLKHALNNNFNYIATGHYARIIFDENSGRFLLKRALDLSRDQSYVLYMLTQNQLEHTLFPLGNLTKAKVRAIAEQNNFVNARKHDSQDICFVPDKKYAKFIENYTGTKSPPGKFILKETGEVLGEHKGIINYTIGQRKGLNIASSSPLYVTEIDIINNNIILSHNERELFIKKILVNNINLIAYKELNEPIHAAAKIRYRQNEAKAIITQADQDNLLIEFDEAQRAPAIGQAAVIYDLQDSSLVIGGGTIYKILKH